MGVFLIQVNGKKTIHRETEAEYFWEEPIKYKVYINYNWKMKARRDIWEKICVGDKVLIYSTEKVKPYPKQIRHIGDIQEIKLANKAIMKLKVEKLANGVPLSIIGDEMVTGKLSEKMGRCGQEGFNIGEVEESDLERILELSGST